MGTAHSNSLGNGHGVGVRGNRFVVLMAAAVNAPAVTLVTSLVLDFSFYFSSYGKAEGEVH